MKQKLFLTAFIAFMLIGGQAFQKIESIKRLALIVAIGDYKPGTLWGHLSSLSDDTIVTAALKKQGFESIGHLINEKATIQGIRDQFADLEKRADKGDIVYIHFSSHGQQIWDDSAHADELDGYDEAIVTWDAPAKYFPGYTGEKHLRDDELGKLVNKIRSKVGPLGDVLVVVDACHSGTALRGDITRGNQGAMAPPDFNPLNVKQTNDNGSVDDFIANVDEMAPVVLFSASRAHEPNQEYNGFGSLSLALTQSLDKLRQGDSYRTLFAYINAEMTNMQLRQVPVLEGQTDRSVFGGNEVKQNNYYPVKFVQSSSAVLEGGTLSGLYIGSKIAFLPAGSTEYKAEKAIFTTTISSADISKSFVVHAGELNAYKTNPKQLWAFVVEQSFGANKLKVGAGEHLTGKTKNDVKDNVLKLAFMEWNDKSFDIFIDQEKGKFRIFNRDSSPLFEEVASKEALNIQLAAYMQGKLMREASFSDADINIDLKFTPKHMNGRDEEGYPILESVDSTLKLMDGTWQIDENDIMFLTLSNYSAMDVYINILEIGPTGTVEVVLPDYENNENAFDFILPAGKKNFLIDNFARKLGPGKGKYTYKVFATAVPVSFRSIFNTRGAASDEYIHPAAQLFQYSYRTRGENLSVKKTSGGGTTKEYVVVLK
jgi:metacaspase-1